MRQTKIWLRQEEEEEVENLKPLQALNENLMKENESL